MAGNNININVRAQGLTNSVVKQVNAAQAVINRRPLKLKLDAKGFRQPLGRISGDINEFQKSLDASVARTFAFGAAVGVVAGVDRAFKALVRTTVQVQESLTNINVLLGESSAGLVKFSNDLFDVARVTAQSFDTVATAATEFSRQGLSAAETLKRIQDAMILTRLSGLGAEQSVASLTAAINGFRREAITSTEVINRLANVDASFAVSSKDLADALARAGSTAQGAKVNFNELLAAVTSVQQQTARGGAVIGNAFKSIFTRIQRSKVQETLEAVGVSTRNLNGSFRGGMEILKDYAKAYDTLSDSQKAHTAEQIAGVFQINNLRALVNDLNSEYSIYNRALNVAASSTNEANARNKELNKTLAALTTQTIASVQQVAAAIGNIAVAPAAKQFLGILKDVADFMAKVLHPEEGSKLIKGFLGGIGSFIQGPGVIILGGAFIKLFSFITKQAYGALKQIFAINTETTRQRNLQSAILALITSEESIQKKILTNAGNHAAQEKIVLQALREQTQQMAQQQAFLARMGASPAFRGFGVAGGAIRPRAGPRGASARAAVAAGGQMPPMSTIVANTDEVVIKNFAKKKEAKAIAGRVGGARPSARPVEVPNFNFKRDAIFNREMIAKNGGLPPGAKAITAAQGFVPNFALNPYPWGGRTRFSATDPKDQRFSTRLSSEEAADIKARVGGKGRKGKVVKLVGGGNLAVVTPVANRFGGSKQGVAPLVSNKRGGLDYRFAMPSSPVTGPFGNLTDDKNLLNSVAKAHQGELGGFIQNVTRDFFTKSNANAVLGPPKAGTINVDRLGSAMVDNSGFKGYLFEDVLKAVQGDVKKLGKGKATAAIDINPRALANERIKKFFDLPYSVRKIEVKAGGIENIGNKYINDLWENLQTPGSSVDKAGAIQIRAKVGEANKAAIAERKRITPAAAVGAGILTGTVANAGKLGVDDSGKFFRINAQGKFAGYDGDKFKLYTKPTGNVRILGGEAAEYQRLSEAAARQYKTPGLRGRVRAEGFIPNFASLKKAEKRALGTEKNLTGSGVLDYHPDIGPYVRNVEQPNFAAVKRDHPEGIPKAIENSRKAQGVSRGIPHLAGRVAYRSAAQRGQRDIKDPKTGSKITLEPDALMDNVHNIIFAQRGPGGKGGVHRAFGQAMKQLPFGGRLFSGSIKQQRVFKQGGKTNFEDLVHAFPQLKYRMQKGAVTSGKLLYGMTGKTLGFKNLDDLKKQVNKLERDPFKEALGNMGNPPGMHNVTIQELESRAAIMGKGDQKVYSQIAAALGFVPNLASTALDTVMTKKGNRAEAILPAGSAAGIDIPLAKAQGFEFRQVGGGLADGFIPNFATNIGSQAAWVDTLRRKPAGQPLKRMPAAPVEGAKAAPLTADGIAKAIARENKANPKVERKAKMQARMQGVAMGAMFLPMIAGPIAEAAGGQESEMGKGIMRTANIAAMGGMFASVPGALPLAGAAVAGTIAHDALTTTREEGFENITQQLGAAAAAAKAAADATSRYVGLQEQLNHALEQGNAENALKLQTTMNELISTQAPQLTSALLAAGSNMEKLQKVSAKAQRGAQAAKGLSTAAIELKEVAKLQDKNQRGGFLWKDITAGLGTLVGHTVGAPALAAGGRELGFKGMQSTFDEIRGSLKNAEKGREANEKTAIAMRNVIQSFGFKAPELGEGGAAGEIVDLLGAGKTDEALDKLAGAANIAEEDLALLRRMFKNVDGAGDIFAEKLQDSVDSFNKLQGATKEEGEAKANLTRRVNELSNAINANINQFATDFKTLNKGLAELNESSLKIAVASGQLTEGEAADISTDLKVNQIFEEAAVDFQKKLAETGISTKVDPMDLVNRMRAGGGAAGEVENLLKIEDLLQGSDEDKEAVEELQKIVTAAQDTAGALQVNNRVQQEIARNTRAMQGIATLSKGLLASSRDQQDTLGKLFTQSTDLKEVEGSAEAARLVESMLPGSQVAKDIALEQGGKLRGANIKDFFAAQGVGVETSAAAGPAEVILALERRLGMMRPSEVGGEGNLAKLQALLGEFSQQEAAGTAPFQGALETENQKFITGLTGLLGPSSPLIDALNKLAKGEKAGVDTELITRAINDKYVLHKGSSNQPGVLDGMIVPAGTAAGFVPSFSSRNRGVSRAIKTERRLGGSPVLDYHHSVGPYVRDGATQKNFSDVRRDHRREGMGGAIQNSKAAQSALGAAQGFVPNFLPLGRNLEYGMESFPSSEGRSVVFGSKERTRFKSGTPEFWEKMKKTNPRYYQEMQASMRGVDLNKAKTAPFSFRSLAVQGWSPFQVEAHHPKRNLSMDSNKIFFNTMPGVPLEKELAKGMASFDAFNREPLGGHVDLGRLGEGGGEYVKRIIRNQQNKLLDAESKVKKKADEAKKHPEWHEKWKFADGTQWKGVLRSFDKGASLDAFDRDKAAQSFQLQKWNPRGDWKAGSDKILNPLSIQSLGPDLSAHLLDLKGASGGDQFKLDQVVKFLGTSEGKQLEAGWIKRWKMAPLAGGKPLTPGADRKGPLSYMEHMEDKVRTLKGGDLHNESRQYLRNKIRETRGVGAGTAGAPFAGEKKPQKEQLRIHAGLIKRMQQLGLDPKPFEKYVASFPSGGGGRRFAIQTLEQVIRDMEASTGVAGVISSPLFKYDKKLLTALGTMGGRSRRTEGDIKHGRNLMGGQEQAAILEKFKSIASNRRDFTTSVGGKLADWLVGDVPTGLDFDPNAKDKGFNLAWAIREGGAFEEAGLGRLVSDEIKTAGRTGNLLQSPRAFGVAGQEIVQVTNALESQWSDGLLALEQQIQNSASPAAKMRAERAYKELLEKDPAIKGRQRQTTVSDRATTYQRLLGQQLALYARKLYKDPNAKITLERWTNTENEPFKDKDGKRYSVKVEAGLPEILDEWGYNTIFGKQGQLPQQFHVDELLNLQDVFGVRHESQQMINNALAGIPAKTFQHAAGTIGTKNFQEFWRDIKGKDGWRTEKGDFQKFGESQVLAGVLDEQIALEEKTPLIPKGGPVVPGAPAKITEMPTADLLRKYSPELLQQLYYINRLGKIATPPVPPRRTDERAARINEFTPGQVGGTAAVGALNPAPSPSADFAASLYESGDRSKGWRALYPHADVRQRNKARSQVPAILDDTMFMEILGQGKEGATTALINSLGGDAQEAYIKIGRAHQGFAELEMSGKGMTEAETKLLADLANWNAKLESLRALPPDRANNIDAWIVESDRYLREQVQAFVGGRPGVADADRYGVFPNLDQSKVTRAALMRSMPHRRTGQEAKQGLAMQTGLSQEGRAVARQFRELDPNDKIIQTMQWLLAEKWDTAQEVLRTERIGKEQLIPYVKGNPLHFRALAVAGSDAAIRADFQDFRADDQAGREGHITTWKNFLQGEKGKIVLARNPNLQGSRAVAGSTALSSDAKILSGRLEKISKIIYEEVYGGDPGAIEDVRVARVGFSKGFVPNFSKLGEVATANTQAGYAQPVTMGQVRQTNIPGVGKVDYNRQERVVRTPGLRQPFIVPPRSSRAARPYARQVKDKFGVNPYRSNFAAEGFVPNFIGPEAARHNTAINFDKFEGAVGTFNKDVEKFDKAVAKIGTATQRLVQDTTVNIRTDLDAITRTVGDAVAGAMQDYMETPDFRNKIKMLSWEAMEENPQVG